MNDSKKLDEVYKIVCGLAEELRYVKEDIERFAVGRRCKCGWEMINRGGWICQNENCSRYGIVFSRFPVLRTAKIKPLELLVPNPATTAIIEKINEIIERINS